MKYKDAIHSYVFMFAEQKLHARNHWIHVKFIFWKLVTMYEYENTIGTKHFISLTLYIHDISLNEMNVIT